MSKQNILNETNIKKVIDKTLKSLCETAGDLTWEMDGQKYTTSQNTYRGVPGTTYVYHGEWSDPEIWYDDESINANDIEDSLWNDFREETGSDDEDEFENWLDEKGTDYIKGELDNYLFGMNENKNINTNNKMGQTIKLTEQDLHRMIEESVVRYLNENEMEEGWLGDKWNQMKTAANTFAQKSNDGMGIKNRFNAAKKNWNTQGELNDISNLQQMLIQMLDAKQISPNTTVAQLVGGKYNSGKFGTMTGMAANRRQQIQRRGGMAN